MSHVTKIGSHEAWDFPQPQPKMPGTLQLHRNECSFVQPESVQNALAGRDACSLSRYGQPMVRAEFIHSLAGFLGIERESLCLGHGAEDLLLKLLLLEKLKSRDLILPELSWGEYGRLASGCGYDLHSIPMKSSTSGLHLDRDALPSRIDRLIAAGRKVTILLASTNNPTGEQLEAAWLESLLQNRRWRASCTFVIDAVYEPLPSPLFQLPKVYPHALVLGSFSKFFGLPGLRVGFCAGSLPDIFHHALGHADWQYQVSQAALSELSFYQWARAEMQHGLCRILQTPFRSLRAMPSQGSFFLVQTPFSDRLTASQRTGFIELLHKSEKASAVWPKVFNYDGKIWLRFGLGPAEVVENILQFLIALDSETSPKES